VKKEISFELYQIVWLYDHLNHGAAKWEGGMERLTILFAKLPLKWSTFPFRPFLQLLHNLYVAPVNYQLTVILIGTVTSPPVGHREAEALDN